VISREVVKRTIKFEKPNRLPFDFPKRFGTDFHFVSMEPSPDARPSQGIDEWGAVWENTGATNLGEVKDPPLKNWDEFGQLNIPDVKEDRRWQGLEQACRKAGDRFILGSGLSIYERVHFIRGLENTWSDIYKNPAQLAELLDTLVEMNKETIKRYAELGVDGYFFCDDWGLQDRLMIPPPAWRKLWKPRYREIFESAHERGMLTFLHSCGYILDIVEDLIEVGLDVLQLDQQENMGLDNLGAFAGRVTFFCPVDIQNTMARGNPGEIRNYCRKMVEELGTKEGGFIPRWYSDPAAAGHSEEAIEAMCEEFLRISREKYETV